MRNNICEIESSTFNLRRNVYHLNVTLFVLDTIRLLQGHPRYPAGLTEQDIVAQMKKSPYACGDVEAQVKMSLRNLCSKGFVRLVKLHYRTLGPFAKLALARTQRQFNIAWEHLNDMQKMSCCSISLSNVI